MEPEDSSPGLGLAVERLDHVLEELRHATFGFYGSRLRTTLLSDANWQWSRVHYRLMRTVQATEPMRPTVDELAAALLTDKARASRVIDQAQESGLVCRRIGRLDRRRREIELTDKGRAVLEEVRLVRLDRLREVLGDWSDNDLQTLHEQLRHFNTSVRAASWE